MYKGKTILGIIPARSGSKGLPGKNILPLLGKPLIVWTIEQALESKYLDKVIVSTDGQDIAKLANKNGSEVPFLRPKEFATDDSPTSDVVIHALNYLGKQDEFYDYIAVLEPTSPLRNRGDIDNGIKMLVDDAAADSLVTVGEIHTEHPMVAKKIVNNIVVPYINSKKAIYQRQQYNKAYFPYGVLYLAKVLVYKELKTFYTHRTIPLKIERWQNYEIDDKIDFVIIEKLLEKYLCTCK